MRLKIRKLFFSAMRFFFPSLCKNWLGNQLYKITFEIISKIEMIGDAPKSDQELRNYFERMVEILHECCKKIREDYVLEELPREAFPYNDRFISFILFYEKKTVEDLLKGSKLIEEINRVPIVLHEKIWDGVSLIRRIEKELGLIKKQNPKELVAEIEKEFALQ